jgi:uncharacterized membrane protein/osmotically-inducible protein OsmY
MNERVLLMGTALGAGLMYLLDPVSGKRRRASTRDRMTHLVKETDRLVGQTGRDLRNRYEGAVSEAKRFWTPEEVADDVLAGRVRTALGRVISHPRSVEVSAEHGWITLSGPIIASEESRLLRRIRKVPGVRGVENKLEVYKSTAHISGLQGGVPRQERFELMQTNWSPAIRLLSVLGGGAAALYGLRRRDLTGLTTGLFGIGFAARGLTNTELRELFGVTPREPVEIVLQKTVHVEAPLEKTISMWTDLQNLPRFLPGIQEVKDIGEGRSIWTITLDEKPMPRSASAIARSTKNWEAVTVSSKNMFAWKSQPGALLANSGTLRFDSAAAGTRVQVTISYRPSRGLPSRIAAHWFGPDPARYLAESLAEMKRIIETDERSECKPDRAQPSRDAQRAEKPAPEEAAS